MRSIRPIVVLLVVAQMYGCAGRESEVVRTIDSDMWQSISWKGQPREVVESRWGRPSAIEKLANAGILLRYDDMKKKAPMYLESEVLDDRRRFNPYTEPQSSDVPGFDLLPEVVVTVETRALFRLDPDGNVASYWINPRLKKGDLPRPPSGAAED